MMVTPPRSPGNYYIGFILKRSNIAELKEGSYKFIYSRCLGLALGDQWQHHQVISKVTLDKLEPAVGDKRIAAHVDVFDLGGGRLRFALWGSSGHFHRGKALAHAQFMSVAEHILSLLGSGAIEKKDNKVIVTGVI